MRWIFLIAIILGIGWTANWSYHQLDQAVLITDYTKADVVPKQWALVDFSQKKPEIYQYSATNGYWEIFKGLWPVWTLFSLIFLALIPLTIYLYQGFHNQQITAAQKAQADAEKQARKAESDGKVYEQKVKACAEERVNAAYQEQLSRVHKELEQEWDNYHQLKKQIQQRESQIQNRESIARKAQEDAKSQISEIQKQYALKLTHFETETTKLRKARDNAQAGYQRLKMKKSPKQKQP